jgi:hypothetical protein
MDELKLSFNSSKTPAGSYLGEYYQMLYILMMGENIARNKDS